MKILEVFPYLRLRNAAAAVDFYPRAFGAEPGLRIDMPDGRVGHAEVKLGGSVVMFADEFPELNITGPETVGGTTFAIHLHVDDADACVAQAVAAGAVVIRPLANHDHGERSGAVRDPFGHEWLIGGPLT